MLEYFVYNFQTFMMMMARLLGLFFIAPVFASEGINTPYRILLAFFTCIILFPVTASYMMPVPTSMGAYYLIILSEIFIGVLMGFILGLVFATFQMAGEYFSIQIGFGYTEVLDPVSQTSLPIISTLKNLMAIMVFLIIGAHRVVIETLALSFQKVQLHTLTAEIQNGIMKTFALAIGAMFVIAFKIALPVLGVLILVTIAEAFMGKAAPQMNILQLSFPAKIMVGMIVMILIVPFIEQQMVRGFEISLDQLQRLIREWPK
ncbi:MAG: flagellar biosynthetic protein FliR [Leptospiraceae bacterium]|nr:flagellar biosynthetic protein FliR [Leptospiraceae bacterium]